VKEGVSHLPRTHSDHCPMLIELEGLPSPLPSLKPFRFEAAWMVHPTFPDLAAASWCFPNLNLLETLDHFKSSLLDHFKSRWNRDVFGNLFRKKRRTLARIEGIQKYLADRFSPYLANLSATDSKTLYSGARRDLDVADYANANALGKTC